MGITAPRVDSSPVTCALAEYVNVDHEDSIMNYCYYNCTLKQKKPIPCLQLKKSCHFK